jgi:hypothetical protein
MMKGVTELAKFTSLKLVLSHRIAAVEFSDSILGQFSQVPDARKALTILVNSLLKASSIEAIKFDKMSDQDIKVLRARP